MVLVRQHVFELRYLRDAFELRNARTVVLSCYNQGHSLLKSLAGTSKGRLS
jgi:hypothetical protein